MKQGKVRCRERLGIANRFANNVSGFAKSLFIGAGKQWGSNIRENTNLKNFGKWEKDRTHADPHCSNDVERAGGKSFNTGLTTASYAVVVFGGTEGEGEGGGVEGETPGGERYSGRYADGQKAYRTNVPRDAKGNPEPLPEAKGAHSRLQRDAKDPNKVYSATEFDANGMAVKRTDFAGRQAQPVPHTQNYNPGTKAFSKDKEPLQQK